jgi:hypothetical protein
LPVIDEVSPLFHSAFQGPAGGMLVLISDAARAGDDHI